MRVLAYLLTSSGILPQDEGTTRILFGTWVTNDDDEAHLQVFVRIISKLEKVSLNTLRTALPFKWNENEPYDTVNPFGDIRGIDFHALWTFNLDDGILLQTNRYHRRRIPLSCLRNGLITLASMEYLGPPVPLRSNPTHSLTTPCWRPQVLIDKRTREFTHRILRDFDRQWRHILRNSYNAITLRVLARALLLLSKLDFDIYEETKQRHGRRGSHVWITQLPTWRPLEAGIVCFGKVHAVVCHSIQEGISIVQKHATSLESIATNPYMILSIKHIMLCRATSPNVFEYTAPERLFNGNPDTEPPSTLALDYLIWAVTPSVRPNSTRLHLLPIEIQDNILKYVSAGSVAAAKIGCLLGVGSVFQWKDGVLNISLEETWTNRTPWSPVESQLWFSKSEIGLVYRGRS
ncbi:uncharacterized protein BDR25DRAFT_390589 [Lindgomyces ingoldianus]|uniref:Uncharacterized protein n=1 Tax=Lindgomyces ingoldianus TaxID=673940 RepID=A0ACB6RBZ8_9PLEO|nr:uncharacterized protein BDR25DRAFT_390589 [Lindgomyces ingoldianus]KAF2476818.1 hypothetical protein BDR25DRAFT_390589 [Lindgomyces ingoldianus]